MPARLKNDARCPVCDEKIIAICRVTSRTTTSLQFDHEENWRGRHDISGDDMMMTVIFDRLSFDPATLPVDTKPVDTK